MDPALTILPVSARRPVRDQMLHLVRENVRCGVDLFEQDFQPWSRKSSWWSYLMP
jgi:hypothetical protein